MLHPCGILFFHSRVASMHWGILIEANAFSHLIQFFHKLVFVGYYRLLKAAKAELVLFFQSISPAFFPFINCRPVSANVLSVLYILTHLNLTTSPQSRHHYCACFADGKGKHELWLAVLFQVHAFSHFFAQSLPRPSVMKD